MSNTVQLGANTLDLIRGELSGPAGLCPLTELEGAFLAYLGRRMGTLVPKNDLLHEVWGYNDSVQSRAVDATLVRIRSKLDGTGLSIESVRGRGLALHAEQLAPAAVPIAEPVRSDLVGREQEFQELQHALQRPGVVCLWGPPGIGKTALSSSLPGIRVLQGTGEVALERELCQELRCTSEDLLAALASDRRTWVLDEAEGRHPDEIELVRAWGTAAAVLVVGTMKIEARHTLRLEPLSEADCIELLVRLTGIPRHIAGRLVSQTDLLPRQITLLAEAVRFLGTESLLELGGGSFPMLEKAVEGLWDDLEPDEREVLAAVTVFHDQFCVRAVSHVTGKRPFEVLPVMERLWSKSLVQGERGIFRLLAPVRSVASRFRTPNDAALVDWCEWLLEENAQDGRRWTRHLEDLGYALRVCSDDQAPVIGMLVLENGFQGNDITDALKAASTRNGRPRGVVLAMQLLYATMHRRKAEAEALAALLQKPLDPPSNELVRRAALLAAGPLDAPADPLVELEDQVPFLLFVSALCMSAGLGWRPSVPVCERYATMSDRIGYPAASIALYTWATRTARNADDPKWVEYARRGGPEGRFALPLRLGDPEAALAYALDRLEHGEFRFERVMAAGIAACVYVGHGRDLEAIALIDRFPGNGYGASTYLHLARAVLGRPATFPIPGVETWIEAWRRGDAPTMGARPSDMAVVYGWVLGQRKAPEAGGPTPGV